MVSSLKLGGSHDPAKAMGMWKLAVNGAERGGLANDEAVK